MSLSWDELKWIVALVIPLLLLFVVHFFTRQNHYLPWMKDNEQFEYRHPKQAFKEALAVYIKSIFIWVFILGLVVILFLFLDYN